MDKRTQAAAASRKTRRRNTILIALAVVIFVATMIVYEQVQLLYVLSTLSVVALLIVVGWSNIEGARRPAGEPPPLDDSAAVGAGITAAVSNPRPRTRVNRSRR